MDTRMPEWVLIGLVGLILSLIAWSVRRLVGGQDSSIKELREVSTAVTKICGNIELANQKIKDSDETCNERHQNNIKEHHRIMEVLEKFRT